jgi:c-di-GMP-binding flagellar brake protein YcgR
VVFFIESTVFRFGVNFMTPDDRRLYLRTSMSATVKVEHETLGSFVFGTRDISDGGVFVAVEDQQFAPQLGDKVTVQVQGLPMEAPILQMVVRRKTPEGYGLQFADSNP